VCSFCWYDDNKKKKSKLDKCVFFGPVGLPRRRRDLCRCAYVYANTHTHTHIHINAVYARVLLYLRRFCALFRDTNTSRTRLTSTRNYVLADVHDPHAPTPSKYVSVFATYSCSVTIMFDDIIPFHDRTTRDWAKRLQFWRNVRRTWISDDVECYCTAEVLANCTENEYVSDDISGTLTERASEQTDVWKRNSRNSRIGRILNNAKTNIRRRLEERVDVCNTVDNFFSPQRSHGERRVSK